MQAFRLWLNDQQGRENAVAELSRLVRRDGCLVDFGNERMRPHLAREHHPTESPQAEFHAARD